MKRTLLILCILLFCLCLVSCEKKEEFAFDVDEIVQISTTPVGGVETYEMYTINIKIYADGSAEIFADNFNKWLGEDDIPVDKVRLSAEEIEGVKDKLMDEGIPYLHNNVGNKDNILGEKKYITLYSTKGEYTVGGISPSNREFIRAYDYIYELVREEVFIYISGIREIQEKGFIRFQNRNVKLTDELDEPLLTDENINQIYYEEIVISPDEGVYAASTESAREVYCVVLEFNKNGAEYLRGVTENCQFESMNIKLHINNIYNTTIVISNEIIDGKISFGMYSKEEAEALVAELQMAIQ